MTIALTSPITGAAQTGFTSPTYTHVADTYPEPNGKQYAVTALGGTQAGVTTHSIASPFTVAAVKPKVWKLLQLVDALTGVIRGTVQRNASKIITRKGVTVLVGQAYQTMVITTTIDVPAGADTADPANVRAALSAHIGALWQTPAGIGDTVTSGVL